MKKLLFLSTLALLLGSQAFGMDEARQACDRGDIARVQVLLAQGVSFNEPDELGWTPFHSACSAGQFAIVNLLLEKGNIQFLIINNAGYTPADVALTDEIKEL